MAVKPIPDGYRSLTPHLVLRDAAATMEFYKQAFGAEELARMPGPGGKIMHAEMRIGDSKFMMNDEFPEMGARAPISIGGSPVNIHLYVPDADASFERAVAAGAKVKMPLADQFWGDRYGCVEDPSGHVWSIATHQEDLSSDQIAERAAKFSAGQ
jgi:uncharacterized glyoxalase superfamily protein PhnB